MGGILNKSITNQRKKEGKRHDRLAQVPPPLENKNESCYMNAIIQALGSCSKMRDDLENYEKMCKSEKLKAFIELLKALNSQSAQKEFNTFMFLHGWCKQGQQDSYEMMSFIINSIYTEMKEILSKQSVEKKEPFPGVITMCSKTSCACKSRNQNLLQDFALHLPLVNQGGNNYKICDMIETIFKKDHVDEICNKCSKMQTLSLSLEGEPPKTLCFHIQANQFDFETGLIIKPEYTLEYPYHLEFKGKMYELVSFLEHLGGISVGHYVAYRKFKGVWFSVNDNIVARLKQVRDPTLHCGKPYVLFYELFMGFD